MNGNFPIMRAIARIADIEEANSRQAQSRVAPALRLVVCIAAILLVSLSRNAAFVLLLIAVELVRTALLSPERIRRIVLRLPLPVLMTALLMLPAVFLGSPRSMLTVTMKVFCAVLLLAVLNEKLTWREVTGGLAALHLPPLVVLTLDTTVRFVVLLGRYSDRILEAVSLRRVGRKNWKNAATGGILGTTWLKSQQMAQANAEAMTCRCFAGVYKKRPNLAAAKDRKKELTANLAYALLFPALLVFFFYSQGLV